MQNQSNCEITVDTQYTNRPFPGCSYPLFQTEAKCKRKIHSLWAKVFFFKRMQTFVEFQYVGEILVKICSVSVVVVDFYDRNKLIFFL